MAIPYPAATKVLTEIDTQALIAAEVNIEVQKFDGRIHSPSGE